MNASRIIRLAFPFILNYVVYYIYLFTPEIYPIMNKIYIIGYGAIGKVLAVALKLNGHEVCIIRGSIADAPPQLQEITVESASGNWPSTEIHIGSLQQFRSLEDGIIVLANKSFGNARLSEVLQSKVGNAPIVIMQNGLGVERSFIEKGFSNIYRTVLFATSQNLQDGLVRFKPVAASAVGVVKGNEQLLNETVEQLNTPQFPFRAEKSIQPVIWKKAISNCVFNSICPLLETDNGIFHRDENALALARRIIAECVEIAAAEGIRLHADEVEASLLQISRSSDGQLISTYQDILNKRETEIETLNLEVAAIAQRLHKQHVVRETRLLGELTLLKSKLHR
ncbi:2-dehydropantoate 2-reductase [Pseudobacter ginsenosidimutans]|uniref:2-dehydropantoate 2-reductase n=2 Tax=Pseudobacter ginsenosidimutans TaxID=661488 RepID=A0A4Q7MUY7_9BACT|nr:2-dehydropantoate 2-reductase [Pseudobacter ginsenosidimutans]